MQISRRIIRMIDVNIKWQVKPQARKTQARILCLRRANTIDDRRQACTKLRENCLDCGIVGGGGWGVGLRLVGEGGGGGFKASDKNSSPLWGLALSSSVISVVEMFASVNLTWEYLLQF
jgi:hypothetical protein